MSREAQGPSPSTLRIAVIGVGGIGSAFAFQLAGVGGHDVTAVARPGSPRLQHLLRDQAVVKTTGERVNIRVTDRLDEEIAYDLLIVTPARTPGRGGAAGLAAQCGEMDPVHV